MESDVLTVMIVDDSPIIIKKLSGMFQSFGYKVVKSVLDGKEAVESYRELKPDIVTMDITMPEMDGIEATKTIISEFPDAKIVMITSHGQEKMVLDALKVGAKGYVLKPFQQQKVYETIQRACDKKIELQFW